MLKEFKKKMSLSQFSKRITWKKNFGGSSGSRGWISKFFRKEEFLTLFFFYWSSSGFNCELASGVVPTDCWQIVNLWIWSGAYRRISGVLVSMGDSPLGGDNELRVHWLYDHILRTRTSAKQKKHHQKKTGKICKFTKFSQKSFTYLCHRKKKPHDTLNYHICP